MARLHMPLLILCSLLMLVAPASADRDGRGHDDDDHKQDWEGEFLPPDLPPGAEEFRVVPLRRAVEIALARFDGRVVAAAPATAGEALARIARQAADHLAGPAAEHLATCGDHDCSMLFHDPAGRRRWR